MVTDGLLEVGIRYQTRTGSAQQAITSTSSPIALFFLDPTLVMILNELSWSLAEVPLT